MPSGFPVHYLELLQDLFLYIFTIPAVELSVAPGKSQATDWTHLKEERSLELEETCRIDKPLPKIFITESQAPDPDDENAQRQQVLNQAWRMNDTLRKDELSKSQQRADTTSEKFLDAITRPQSSYDSMMLFYNENQPALAAAAATLVNLNGELKDIEATMSTFIEYCPIVVRGLESLSQLHPFIGIATKAFSLVITMDLTRRNNNWKVIALKMQIQDTMMILFDSVAFRLRHVKDPDQKDPAGNTMENRMGTLVKKIAEDITEVRSACDHYIKKSFVAKTLKSSKYEACLAAYGDIFAEYYKKLKLALSIHTAVGVDSANTKLDTLSLQMEHIQVAMAALLQKLDTSREKDLKDFIDIHGGPKACLQDDQLVQMLINISGEVSALKAGAHDQIIDADWKGSVEARHFVLALQDFYIENLTGLSRVASPITPTSIASSNWPVALKYINISKAQPILKAIDDDGTGFISIKEVNTFALSKPKGWSLPVWIAYWATGWHVVIARYKDKIHAVIHEMFKVIDYNTHTVLPNNKYNLPANCSKIDQYLKFGMFYRIDLLLCSLRPLGNNNINDVRLEQIIDTYSSSEEKRLEENLECVAYDIDTPATVTLVTGPERIERFILPLIYLLLRRHLKAFYLARTHILDEQEFWDYTISLCNVFAMLDDRISGLADRKITGVAEAYRELMNVSGSISLDNKLTLILTFENWEAAFTCEGQYDPKLETLSGKASSTDEETENSDENNNRREQKNSNAVDEDELEANKEGEHHTNQAGDRASGETNTFFFTRTPTFAWHFHSVLDQRSNSARECWIFAIGAVLDQVQRTQCFWNYLKSRNIERRHFLALVLCREVAQSLSPANPLKKDERLEFCLLIAKLHPTDARFYYSLIPSLANVELITHLCIYYWQVDLEFFEVCLFRNPTLTTIFHPGQYTVESGKVFQTILHVYKNKVGNKVEQHWVVMKALSLESLEQYHVLSPKSVLNQCILPRIKPVLAILVNHWSTSFMSKEERSPK
ncbi:hypothetical protein EV368DRAFT_65857 [Lentinula lateritia]|nr:hypothetical protein EV368DRAFT_65857 [Lentinula lateritia]